jgi:hypothetical protein
MRSTSVGARYKSPCGRWRLDMSRTPTVSISMRELDRLKCIQSVIDGELKLHNDGPTPCEEANRRIFIDSGFNVIYILPFG